MAMIDPETLFSPDYRAARAAFLAAAAAAGARLTSVEHPVARGPGGKALHMDLAVLGDSKAPAALCVISGTHGPEGYAGSAVQTGLLRSGLAQRYAERQRVILIHAHNPYGFAWDTRFNEDNIDLNRNYLASFAPPLPANPGYEAVAAWAAPASRDAETMAAAEARLMEFARDHGFAALQAAVSGGQFTHPKGVYFGGAAPSWSRTTLTALLSEAAAGVARLASIDIHSGLGPEGHGEIIFEHPPGTPAHDLIRAIWGDEPKTTKDGSSVSADLVGTLDSAIETMFPDAEVAAVALEFGTVDTMSVFRATQASSWLHCYGDPEGPDAPAIRQAIRDAFYPQSAAWRAAVWTRAAAVIERAAV